MAEKLIALVVIEYPGKDKVHRLNAGDPLPDNFPQKDVAELREFGSIGTAADYEAAKAQAEAEAAKSRAIAAAKAAGLLVVDSDAGSAADRNR